MACKCGGYYYTLNAKASFDRDLAKTRKFLLRNVSVIRMFASGFFRSKWRSIAGKRRILRSVPDIFRFILWFLTFPVWLTRKLYKMKISISVLFFFFFCLNVISLNNRRVDWKRLFYEKIWVCRIIELYIAVNVSLAIKIREQGKLLNW